MPNGLIDKARSAAHIDHLRRLGIVRADGLAFVPRHIIEKAHRGLQTLGAGQLAAARQGHAQREIIDVAVGGGGVVGDGVGEAVFVGAVFEARGLVERSVGDEAGVGLADHGVLELVVCAAVAVELELLGEGRHDGGAGGEDDVAGGVKGVGYGGGGFRGCEEGYGCLVVVEAISICISRLKGRGLGNAAYLKEQAEGHAACKGVVVEEGV